MSGSIKVRGLRLGARLLILRLIKQSCIDVVVPLVVAVHAAPTAVTRLQLIQLLFMLHLGIKVSVIGVRDV